MKKFTILLLQVFISFSLFAQSPSFCWQTGPTGPEITAQRSARKQLSLPKLIGAPPVIDGLIDPIWNDPAVLTEPLDILSTEISLGSVNLDLEATAKFMYNNAYLFVLVIVTNDSELDLSGNATDEVEYLEVMYQHTQDGRGNAVDHCDITDFGLMYFKTDGDFKIELPVNKSVDVSYTYLDHDYDNDCMNGSGCVAYTENSSWSELESSNTLLFNTYTNADTIIYEMAMSWDNFLGHSIVPAPGHVFGFDLAVNDVDSDTRTHKQNLNDNSDLASSGFGHGNNSWNNPLTLASITVTDNIVLSDTTNLYDVTFNVTDEITTNPLQDAIINISGIGAVITDINGDAVFSNIKLLTESFFSISCSGYPTSTGTIFSASDTTINISLNSSNHHDVTFIIRDPNNNLLQNAIVSLLGVGSEITDASGVAVFNTVSLLTETPFTISYGSYHDFTGDIMMQSDTTLNITLRRSPFFCGTYNGPSESEVLEQKNARKQLYLRKVSGTTPVIDGLVDIVWHYPDVLSEPIDITAQSSSGSTNNPDLEAEMKMMYDDDYLYLLVIVSGDTEFDLDGSDMNTIENFEIMYQHTQDGRGDYSSHCNIENYDLLYFDYDGDFKRGFPVSKSAYSSYAYYRHNNGCTGLYCGDLYHDTTWQDLEAYGILTYNTDVSTGDIVYEMAMSWDEFLGHSTVPSSGHIFGWDLAVNDVDNNNRNHKLNLNDNSDFAFFGHGNNSWNNPLTLASVIVTDTTISTTSPLIIVNQSLEDFSTSQGIASGIQSYSVSGYNLTNDISITAPTGIELSTNGTVFSSLITLPQSSGTVSNTTIYARISATAIEGSISADIIHASTDASDINIEVTGTVNPAGSPLILVEYDFSTFITNRFTTSVPQTYTVTGFDLTGDIFVIAPGGFELSVDGTIYSTSLTLSQSAGSVPSTTMYVRITALTSQGNYYDNITHTSTGAPDVTASVTGTVNPPGVPLIAVDQALSAFSSIEGIPSNSQTYTVSGTDIIDQITITASGGFEISTDDITYSTMLNIPQSAGTVPLTTIYARISETASLGGISGNLAHTASGASMVNVGLTGTVDPSIPTITVNESLSAFTANTGTVSGSQTYAVSGLYLTADISITAPANIEISTDGVSYFSSLILPHSSGTVSLTTIYVRIPAGAPEGSVSGNIAHTSAGASQVDVVVSGTVNAAGSPLITINRSLNAFSTIEGTASTSQTYTVSGSDLTADIAVTAPINIEISTDGASYSSSLTLPHSTGTVPLTTIYIRIPAGAPEGSILGNITHTSVGATGVNVTINGTVDPAPIITANESLSAFLTIEGIASVAQTYTVSGSGLTADISITAPADFEISTDGTSYSSSLTLPQTSGTVSSTTIYVRIPSGASGGSISGNITHISTGASQVDVAVSGIVNVPLITVDESLNSFITNEGITSVSQTYTISGSNLTSDITIIAPGSFEISTDGLSFSPSLILPNSSGTVSLTNIFVRISASALEGNVSGNITHASSGAAGVNVAVSGTVDAPVTPIITVDQSLSLFSTNEGTASGSQTYTVSGSDLITDISITAPANFEVSTDGASYSSSLTLPHSAGSVFLTNIFVRISASAPEGGVAGNITHISSGATGINVAVTGNVNAVGTPLITIDQSLSSFSTNEGTASVSQTYTVSGSDLTADISVTAPSNFELSINGIDYLSSLTLPHSAGTVSSTTIYVRISAGAPESSVSGNITHTSAGAADANVAVAGTVNSMYSPLITVDQYLNSFSTIEGTAGNAQSYIISGSDLIGDISISAPANFEISADGANFSSSLTLPHSSGSVPSTTIYVRIPAGALEGNVSGNITHTSVGASEVNIAVSGVINAMGSPYISVTQSLLPFTTSEGEASLYQAYFVSGSDLTGDIIINCPPEIELSTNGTDYSAPLTLPHIGGTINAVTIYIRVSSQANYGIIDGYISHISPGAPVVNIPVSASIINTEVLGIHNSLVKIYPNPSHGILTVEIAEISNNSFIEIIDLKGSIIYSKEYNNSGRYEIDLTDQVNGVYIIRAVLDDRIQQGKIVLY